jgi:hypothetical protein
MFGTKRKDLGARPFNPECTEGPGVRVAAVWNCHAGKMLTRARNAVMTLGLHAAHASTPYRAAPCTTSWDGYVVATRANMQLICVAFTCSGAG